MTSLENILAKFMNEASMAPIPGPILLTEISWVNIWIRACKSNHTHVKNGVELLTHAVTSPVDETSVELRYWKLIMYNSK